MRKPLQFAAALRSLAGARFVRRAIPAWVVANMTLAGWMTRGIYAEAGGLIGDVAQLLGQAAPVLWQYAKLKAEGRI